MHKLLFLRALQSWRKMQRMQQVTKVWLLAALVCVLSVTGSHAFSGPGHMIVAAIAYRDLSPLDKQRAVEILSHHTDYTRWVKEVAGGKLELGVVAFMGASKWPDEIKRSSNPWNHEPWHYVDYPVTPPNFAFGKSPDPENDIIYGINKALVALRNTSTPFEEKASWLCMLMHFVGDLHQPLHCASLVNEDFPAPLGDKGGNLIFVRASESSKGVSLHSMWDVSMGSSRGFHSKYLVGYYNDAIALTAALKRTDLKQIADNQSLEQWAHEGWKIAVEDVYLSGKIPLSCSPLNAAILPEGYTKRLKTIAQRQVTAAGYRLADLIHHCLSPDGK